jgi:hypothetical protein
MSEEDIRKEFEISYGIDVVAELEKILMEELHNVFKAEGRELIILTGEVYERNGTFNGKLIHYKNLNTEIVGSFSEDLLYLYQDKFIIYDQRRI